MIFNTNIWILQPKLYNTISQEENVCSLSRLYLPICVCWGPVSWHYGGEEPPRTWSFRGSRPGAGESVHEGPTPQCRAETQSYGMQIGTQVWHKSLAIFFGRLNCTSFSPSSLLSALLSSFQMSQCSGHCERMSSSFILELWRSLYSNWSAPTARYLEIYPWMWVRVFFVSLGQDAYHCGENSWDWGRSESEISV